MLLLILTSCTFKRWAWFHRSVTARDAQFHAHRRSLFIRQVGCEAIDRQS